MKKLVPLGSLVPFFMAGCSLAPLPVLPPQVADLPSVVLAQTGEPFAAAGPVPCGFFTVPYTEEDDLQVKVTLKFFFDTLACAPPPGCDCKEVVYIQAARIWDLSGNSLVPGEMGDRMVEDPAFEYDGWAIDQIGGARYGYFGSYNNGRFNSDNCVPGTNDCAAFLIDRPSGWKDNVVFEAIAAPVCIESIDCPYGIAGFIYWGFKIENGIVEGPFVRLGTSQHVEAFKKAVKEWNLDATDLMKVPFPDALVILP